jgi:predicted AAA+ superfamily ATPase
VEVDFLLRRGRDLVAIEVKGTARPGPSDFAGLRAIGELKATKRRILVHSGERPFKTAEGVEALPPDELIRLLSDGRL